MAKSLNKSTKLLIVAGIAAVGFAVYWFFIRKKGMNMSTPSNSEFDQQDKNAYNALKQHLSANIDPAALDGWLDDIAVEFYTGGRAVGTDYLINGKTSRTAALMAAYASSYQGRGYKNTVDDQTTADKAYQIFYSFKNRYNDLA